MCIFCVFPQQITSPRMCCTTLTMKGFDPYVIAHGGPDSFPFLYCYHKYHTSLSISHGQLEYAFSRHKTLAILKNKRNEDNDYTFLHLHF